MKRLAPSLLGFVGTLVPLTCLAFLRDAMHDGLDSSALPMLSRFVAHLAPIGPVFYVVPILVAVGVWRRTGGLAAREVIWPLLGAILMGACVIGAVLPAYDRLIHLDGGATAPATVARWTGNFLLTATATVFALYGVRGGILGTRPLGNGQGATRPVVESQSADKPQPQSDGSSSPASPQA